jgi:hypothetical protein
MIDPDTITPFDRLLARLRILVCVLLLACVGIITLAIFTRPTL